MRQIIKYKNRKYYDKKLKGYVTLKGLQALINNGESFTVTEKETNKDITYPTLVNVLSSKLNTNQVNNESIIELINL
jgi:polyhydroxyalkanoate synthesis regulator protein